MMLASLLLAAGVASPTPTTTASDPYRIYARARSYWEMQRYPSSVDYVIHVAAKMKRDDDQRHYNARWFAATNAVTVDGISAEERDHPFHPGSGFTLAILIPIANVGSKGTGVNGDLLGLPVLAPNYNFGIAKYVLPRPVTPAELVAEIRKEFHDPSPAKVEALAKVEGPPTIATVYAIDRDYTIALVGVEPYGDHRDYHLKLQPTHDPGRYRLRQLWIDTDTYATDRLVSQGNFVDGPGPGVAWNVTFDNVGDAHYIASETALASMPGTWPDGPLTDFTVSFEDVRITGTGAIVHIFPAKFDSAPTLTEPKP